MIQSNEFRTGNFILQKQQHRIVTVAIAAEQWNLISRGEVKDMHPILLKPEWLMRSGFIENESYPLRPGAREYVLAVPVHGSQQNEIRGWVKTNGECFCRALVAGVPVSNNIFHVHSLQNLYFALTGEELTVAKT